RLADCKFLNVEAEFLGHRLHLVHFQWNEWVAHPHYAKWCNFGTSSRKSSSLLPARSSANVARPVALPPGCAKLETNPVATGSPAVANTIGMADVACFSARTCDVPDVTIMSTFSRTNSAAMSADRSSRPSLQRYSMAIVRPSIQPSSRSR